jgi:hypothetical protein
MVLLLLALTDAALAQQISVNLDPTLSAAAGVNADTYDDQMRGAMNEQLSLDDQQDFLVKMANATTMSTKGMGVDYASNPQRFVAGVAFGSAVNSNGVRLGWGDNYLPNGGFAFQLAAMAGINFGVGAKDGSPARHFRLYVNGMASQANHAPFTGDLLNLGAHMQFNLGGPTSQKKTAWGGFNLTTGFEHARYRVGLAESVPVESGKITWDADGTYEITATSNSIPVELSTGMQLRILSPFLGAAVDITPQGNAVSDIALTGDITVRADGETQKIGSATASISSVGQGDLFTPRFFGGLQINLAYLRRYGQLNAGLDRSFGGHVGARFAL